ncbi:mitochondrial inner-membrane-bound regulator-domain-containing protein [Aspergillus crustosus]
MQAFGRSQPSIELLRPRFELVLRIIDLNNIPLVSGTAYIRWRLPSSNANEHHGATDKALIIDHRASWNYEKTVQLRITIDRDQTLQQCEILFDVIQEFSSGGHSEKNLLGRVKLNLSEYVDKSDDEEGIVRRYLMQDSKINSTLKIGIAVQQMEGDRNFTTPPLKSAMAFGGITGVVASEPAEMDDLGQLPLINTQSREVADMQEMYRRTLAASWTSSSDELPADKLIEGLFSGSIGQADPRNTDSSQSAEDHFDDRSRSGKPGATGQVASRNLLSPAYERRSKSRSRHANGTKALDFSPAIEHAGKTGSIEHQLYDGAKGKSWRNRNTDHELSEFDVRENLRSWEARLNLMLSQSSRRLDGLLSCRLLPSHRSTLMFTSLSHRGAFARYHDDASNTDRRITRGEKNEEDSPHRPKRHKRHLWYGLKEKVRLQYDFLGSPGDVLVVRENRLRDQPADPEDVKPDTSAIPSMLSQIESETAPFDMSLVNEQFESFRLAFQPRAKLPPADWVKLHSTVWKSFTEQQLKDYIATQTEFDGTFSTLRGFDTWDAAEWRPGTSRFLETGSNSQESITSRIPRTKKLQNKPLLVEYILRDIWGLGILNEDGQLDVRLPAHSLTLLLNSELFSFEEVAELNKAKIDLTRSLGLIRITGSQTACEVIREIIDDSLKRMRQEELNLLLPGVAKPQHVSQAFTPYFLSWLEKTYNVSFEQDASQLPIRICYLLENKAMVDQVRRILNLALNTATTPSIPFTTYLSASKMSETRDTLTDDTASWPDRQKSWFRWGGPPEEKDLAKLPGYFLMGSKHAISDELFRFLQEAPSMQGDFKSVPVVRDSITATVGRCLFLRNSTFQGKKASASQLGTMGLPRTFIQYVPRALQLIRGLGTTGLVKGRNSYRIQLAPTAFYADTFPKLDLSVTISVDEVGNEEGEFGLSSAKAILAESNVDYLLPESATDIRFTRTLTHDILEGSQEVPSLETIVSSLMTCFNESLNSDKKVPLPTFTPVTLPNYLLRNSKGEFDPSGTTTAEYMYLPVNDVQGTRTRQFELRDQPLFFASYESGPFGPLMTTDLYLQKEFSEDASSPNRSDASLQQKEFTSFYRSVCTLASELDMNH